MTLYEECIEALGSGTEVLNESASLAKSQELQQSFPFTTWGRIDWHSTKGMQLEEVSQLQEYFDSAECYIIWDSAEFPVVKTSIRNVINAIDDVRAVSFDTWVLGADGKTVVEFYHEGDVVLASPTLQFAN